ncbi:transporter [Zoogloea sp. LCSB751]|uniref:transporter n=1 Tax=Zoogloea sp. LCSB751 TaxID=1965277 RepID=UPI0009A550A5|nr:transporter [Zoogloea sp. LCSB751]
MTTTQRFALRLCAASLLAAGLSASPAYADVRPDPGDYTGLPAGTNLLLAYAQFPRGDKVYSKGNKVVDNLDLSVNAGILRYVHFMKLGDYIIDPQIIVPFGTQKIGLSDSKTSGLGDVIFGATLWTLADLAKGEHLGWSVFFTAPTGGDKNQGFALSNNRWATDLQVGYIRKLSDKWTVDLIGETEFYQDQRDTKAQKDPLLQAHGHLRYHLSDATYVAATYRHAWGAKEKLDGVELAGAKNNGTAMLTWASFVDKQWQVQLQYVQDLKIEEGPKTSSLQARVLYVY